MVFFIDRSHTYLLVYLRAKGYTSRVVPHLLRFYFERNLKLRHPEARPKPVPSSSLFPSERTSMILARPQDS